VECLSTKYAVNKLWKRGTEFLGCQYGILCGAMAWISDHKLVSSISNAGGFGVLAGGSLSPEAFKNEIQKTKKLTSNPFGVNIITFHPQIDILLNICAEEKVTHVFLGGGIPSRKILTFLKKHDIRILCFSPTLAIGQRLIQMGADALIIEGNEAGGHVGSVSTSVLAQEILPHLSDQVPVFIAGGIGCGSIIVSYLEMGASGCQLGTRFVCSKESIAHDKFKESFIKANSRDAVITQQLDMRFPILPVRVIMNNAVTKFMEIQIQSIDQFNQKKITKKEAQMQIEYFWSGALKRAVINGDVENGSLMAGQSVGMVKNIDSCSTIINSLINEMIEHIKKSSHVA
jgi:enoyl-[acyl-carrier protein] reductase II